MVLTNILHPIVGLSLFFLALFCNGILIVDRPLKVAPFDMIFFIYLFLILVMLSYKKKICITFESIIALEICILILSWMSFQALRSPDIVRAITLLIIAVRDIAAMILTSILISDLQDKSRLRPYNSSASEGPNQCDESLVPKRMNVADIAFWTGLLVVLTAIPLYLLLVSNPENVILNPRPGLIYWAGEGLFPHFQGFNYNPIYLAIIVLMSIFAGLTITVTTKTIGIIRVFGLIVLVLVFFAANSRGAIIAMLIGGLFMLCASSKLRRLFISKSVLRPFLFSLLSLSILANLRIPGYESSLIQRMIFRFQEAAWYTRVENWSGLLTGFHEHLFIGFGLRAAELSFYGQAVENSYLDTIYDQGLIGLLIWIIFIMYISVLGIYKLRNDYGVLPWVYTWIVILLAMGYISLQYDPLVWVVVGVIVGWKSAKQENL